MSELKEYVDKYEEELLTKTKIKSVDSKLLYAVTKACGPSIYKSDGALVAVSDKKEIERVKKSFLVSRLGLKDGKYLDSGIKAVIEQIGVGNRKKYRVMFYYLLVKHFNAKSALLIEDSKQNSTEKLASFGEDFILSQKSIDSEIREATEKNFADLLL